MASKLWLAAGIFVIGLTMRVSNAPQVFAGGVPRIAPFDALYHWKRIAWSAAHMPHVLEFDPDRGVHGAFCPWPPLYDLGSAGIARLLGARAPLDVLRRIVWIPPLLAAFCVALAALLVARAYGMLSGLVLGIALATSPFLVIESSIGDIDHHFLEWPLIFAILGSLCVVLRGGVRVGSGLLALSMLAAMFTQPALLIACGLAFAVLFAATDGAAAAIAFSVTATVIAAYRITRPPGYPDSPWFLGWAHVALFAGAAVASLLLFLRGRRAVALLLGMATVFAIPSAPASILAGTRFFGGQRWLQTIAEFQPMWKGNVDDFVSELAGLSAGLILVWILAAYARRRRDAERGAIAFFAIVYLLLSISSRRFWSAGIPLLALAGAVCVTIIPARRWRLLAAAAVALIPAVQLGLWLPHLEPPVGADQIPWIRAALFLQTQPRMGRVLAPWSLGHVLDVAGQHAVIIDNFGTMPDPMVFGRANDALLALDEKALARYCEETGVRWVVIDNPVSGLRSAAASIGLDPDAFVATDAQGRPRVTSLGRATWWWSAYFRPHRPFTSFRLRYAEPKAIMVWEAVARVR